MLPSLTFLLAAGLLAILPGPGIAYVVARTAAGGRAEGVASTLGASLGGLLHVLAGALGLSLLFAHSPLAFALVQYLGAGYLFYLGLRLWLSRSHAGQAPALAATGAWPALRDGVLVEALNVKTALFFLAFIPQFIRPHQAFAPQFMLLGILCVLLNSSVDLLAVLATSRILASGRLRLAGSPLFARLSGGIMLLLGLMVAVSGPPGL